MTAKIEVFTSPTCPHCPSAVNLAKEIAKERDDVKVELTSTATNHGSKRARTLDVMSVPTTFVTGPEFDRIGFRGLPKKSSLIDAIDISLGLKSWEETVKNNKSIFQKIKEKIPIKIKF